MIEESRRPCTKCGELTPLIAFATFRRQDGVMCRRGICRVCRDAHVDTRSEEQRAYRAAYNKRTYFGRALKGKERRRIAREFVDAYKNRPCADCGACWPPVAMDLDHVRGGKFRAVSSLVSGAYKLGLIAIELEKCDVVCACCHRMRTAARHDNAFDPSIRAVLGATAAEHPEVELIDAEDRRSVGLPAPLILRESRRRQ
jgi:hypothetical protein